MFHPVGSQPPSVYWRRRTGLLVALVVLIVITAWVLRPGNGDGSPRTAGQSGPGHVTIGTQSPSTTPPGTTPAPTTTPANTTAASTSAPGSTATQSGSAGHSPSGTNTAPACTATQLQVSAVTGAPTYHVGDQPVVMLQVSNAGTAPCMQDLADSQVELLVYNGESRVWGSHDCEIQPGTDLRKLAPGQPVRVSVTWSGLSSQAGCTGTRQHVPAGTYTLYARLSGHNGTAAQFSIV